MVGPATEVIVGDIEDFQPGSDLEEPDIRVVMDPDPYTWNGVDDQMSAAESRAAGLRILKLGMALLEAADLLERG